MSLIREILIITGLDDEHSAACRSFIDSIHRRNRIVLAPFDLDNWGEGAESTLVQGNRTSRHPRISTADRSAIANQAWRMLTGVRPEEFDCAFFKLAFEIRQHHLPYMTFGRTQKFLNILCKYAYCYYWSSIDLGWNAKNAWVRTLSPFFHIPVDSIVLGNLRRENTAWFRRLLSPSLSPRPPQKAYSRFHHGDATVGWSLLDRTYPYIAVQQYVLDNLRGAKTPLHREMRDLFI